MIIKSKDIDWKKDEDFDRYLATVVIGDTPFHAEAIEVQEDEEQSAAMDNRLQSRIDGILEIYGRRGRCISHDIDGKPHFVIIFPFQACAGYQTDTTT